MLAFSFVESDFFVQLKFSIVRGREAPGVTSEVGADFWEFCNFLNVVNPLLWGPPRKPRRIFSKSAEKHLPLRKAS